MTATRRSFLATAATATLAGLLPTWLVQPARRRINLMDFCLPAYQNSSGYRMDQPFEQEDWLYATNGHICLRVRPETADTKLGEERLPPAAGLHWPDDQARWRKMPEPIVFLAHGYCHACDGHAHEGNLQECPKCEGWGCKACFGMGSTGDRPCPQCGGKPLGNWPCLARIEEQYYQVHLIDKVRSLGDLEISQNTRPFIPDHGYPLAFRFEGGTGLLMPFDQSAARRNIELARKEETPCAR